MALILGDIRPGTSNKLIHLYNDIPYKKKIGTVNAYDNRYIEIIVKLEQKNNGTYGCIAISKDIVILSIVMRRFYCTAKRGVPRLPRKIHRLAKFRGF